jgi:hypothetical protein
VERLSRLSGTCETGAMFAWEFIREMAPAARFAVVRRDPEAVCLSLAKFGFDPAEYLDEMHARDEFLDEITEQPDVLSVDFDQLAQGEVCAALYEHCRGRPMSGARWAHLDGLNIQVDMPKRISRLQANAEQIETLKAEIRRRQARA